MALFGVIVPVQINVCAEGCFPPARFYDVFGAGLLTSKRLAPETPTKGNAMKVHIEMDMTPEEARAFMGLPDVAPLQKKMMEDMQARMKAAFDANDLDGDDAGLDAALGGREAFQKFQKAMWDGATAMLNKDSK